jgi:GT2 family glycosyltransferase
MRVKIIYHDKNIGFALGNNEASKYANGKYILLLNSDTISDFKVYEELIEYMKSNKSIGVIGLNVLMNLVLPKNLLVMNFLYLKKFLEKYLCLYI